MTEPTKVLTREEATKLLQEHCSAAYAAIAEAEKIAVEYGIEFTFDVAYGMGGTFFPEGDSYYTSDKDPVWVASSHMC